MPSKTDNTPTIEAYEAALISGRLPASRRVIYDDLHANGPSTAREIAARTGHANILLNRSRFNELEAQGLIRRVGTRRDQYSETATTLWEAVRSHVSA